MVCRRIVCIFVPMPPSERKLKQTSKRGLALPFKNGGMS